MHALLCNFGMIKRWGMGNTCSVDFTLTVDFSGDVKLGDSKKNIIA